MLSFKNGCKYRKEAGNNSSPVLGRFWVAWEFFSPLNPVNRTFMILYTICKLLIINNK